MKLIFGGDDKVSFVDGHNMGRKEVGVGPFNMSLGRNPVEHRELITQSLDKGKQLNRDVAASVASTIASIPLRLISHKTKTSLSAPADFSPDWLKSSAQLPPYDCVL